MCSSNGSGYIFHGLEKLWGNVYHTGSTFNKIHQKNSRYNFLEFLFFQYDTDGSGQIEFPEFCNMMSAKMGTINDEDMIRMAFRVLDKDGRGTIKSSAFKHLMTHIG